jgi:preprotein translocase subunit YajC
MTAIALLHAAAAIPSGLTATLFQVLPIVAIGAIFYFVAIAPANKQRRETQKMLAALKKGDQVVTVGGIYGTIQSVEPDVVFIRISENAKVKLARSAVTQIVSGSASE